MARKAYTAEQIDAADYRIRRTCHSKQRAFVFDPANRCTALVGRGGGKTVAMLFRLLRRMLRQPDANCLFIAATRQSAERLVWRDLKRVVSESLRLAGAKFNETDLVLELPNGSRLMLFGCDDRGDIQKLRGITYHEVGIDEVASIKITLLDELLLEVLGPRLVGALCLIGSPGKRLEGLFYDTTRPGSDAHRPWTERDRPEFAGWTKWSSHAWKIEDGVDEGIRAMVEIHAAQLAEIERHGWGENNPYRLREFGGVWAADSTSNVFGAYAAHKDGKAWNQWEPELDAFGFAKHGLKDVGFAIGMDVGFKDAFAIEVFAFSYTDPSRTLWHVYELYLMRQYANSVAKLLIGERLDHSRYGGIFGHIGWPDVLVGDFANAGGPLLTELQTVYGITVKEAAKQYRYKENSIELTNSMFYEGQIKVMKGSALERELNSLQWVVDQYGKRMENKAQANHACDAMIYLRDAVASLLPNAGPGGTTHSGLPSAPTRHAEEDDVVAKPQREYGDADSMYGDNDY